MSPTPAIYTAFTAPVNPPNASPKLTRAQVWAGLEIKVEHAQDFVSAIISTDVLDKSTDEQGRKVTTREVVFREGNRRVKEVVTNYEPTKVDFRQPDGSHVQNVISEGSDGELYMTYDFEWLYPGMEETELKEREQKTKGMAKFAVEGSIAAIREMVKSGRITA